MSHEARTSKLGFTATKHVIRRVRRRMGLPKKAVLKEIEKAYNHGRRAKSFCGAFREYLDDIIANDGPANKVIVHGTFLFLICETTGCDDRILTGYHVPPEHRNATKRKKKW